MPMHGVLKSLIEKKIRIELKNRISITGTLKDVDTFLNMKILRARVVENPDQIFVGFEAIESLFIRGSFTKFIWIKESDVDLEKMEDSVRKTMVYKKILNEDKEKEDNAEEHIQV